MLIHGDRFFLFLGLVLVDRLGLFDLKIMIKHSINYIVYYTF